MTRWMALPLSLCFTCAPAWVEQVLSPDALVRKTWFHGSSAPLWYICSLILLTLLSICAIFFIQQNQACLLERKS